MDKKHDGYSNWKTWTMAQHILLNASHAARHVGYMYEEDIEEYDGPCPFELEVDGLWFRYTNFERQFNSVNSHGVKFNDEDIDTDQLDQLMYSLNW